jgi:hypothetical protein
LEENTNNFIDGYL